MTRAHKTLQNKRPRCSARSTHATARYTMSTSPSNVLRSTHATARYTMSSSPSNVLTRAPRHCNEWVGRQGHRRPSTRFVAIQKWVPCVSITLRSSTHEFTTQTTGHEVTTEGAWHLQLKRVAMCAMVRWLPSKFEMLTGRRGVSAVSASVRVP